MSEEAKQMTDEEVEVWNRLNIYYQFLGDKARATLDQMPKNQATLDIIEEELDKFIQDVPGKDKKERWFNLVRGMQAMNALNPVPFKKK